MVESTPALLKNPSWRISSNSTNQITKSPAIKVNTTRMKNASFAFVNSMKVKIKTLLLYCLAGLVFRKRNVQKINAIKRKDGAFLRLNSSIIMN